MIIDSRSFDKKNFVREQAFIDFSIGSYINRVFCNVIPMTCFHIILGIPWQTSRDTIHHGLANVYIVHKDGLKFHLNPSPSNNSNARRILCVSERKHITLEDQTTVCANQKHKDSLVMMKSHVADHKISYL